MPLALAAAALLTPASAWAAFPGLNGKIAYTHQVGMSSSAIYTVNPDGSSPKNLSTVGGGGSMTADFQPAWSANGKQIAFVRVDFQHCSGQIWTMNANGTGKANLSNDAASANEFNPAYGPDGSVAFVRAPAGTFNICAQKAANQGDLWVRSPGGKLHKLTSDGLDNTPAWSPNGKQIAFTRNSAGMPPSGPPHIFVMNANGSGTAKDLGPGVKPNWSPDGTRITFATPGKPGQGTGGPVTVMNANGTHRKIINPKGTAPAWSPDGKKITYLSFTSQMSGAIAVMNPDGTHQHNVTNPGSGNNDVKPDWQPVQGTMGLSVSPRRATAGKRTCFAFSARSGGHGLAGVTIRFAHHRLDTSGSGKAKVCLKLSKGSHVARATKPGFHAATTRVRVRAAPSRRPVHRSGFTG